MQLDHIAVAGETLADAVAYSENALGVALEPGGEHDVFRTHNKLLGLQEGLYFEAIAINPDVPNPDRARWFDLDRFSGRARLTNWICRCDDLEATLASLPDGFGEPVALQRGDLRWRMAVPQSGVLPFDNCAPALMQWDGDAHPVQRLAASDLRLAELTVSHPEAELLAQMLAPHLGDDRIRFTQGPAGLQAQFDLGGEVRHLA